MVMVKTTVTAGRKNENTAAFYVNVTCFVDPFIQHKLYLQYFPTERNQLKGF